jgi:hypothetical protein
MGHKYNQLSYKEITFVPLINKQNDPFTNYSNHQKKILEPLQNTISVVLLQDQSISKVGSDCIKHATVVVIPYSIQAQVL